MQLTLNDMEALELRRALDLHLTRLEEEIARTEDREFKESLLATFHTLDGIRGEMRDQEQARPAYFTAETSTIAH